MSAGATTSASMRAPSRGGKPTLSRRPVAASRRTTITLSPQSQQIVERFKSASGTSTSAAIDRIIQRSEPRPSRLKESDIGLLVLDVPANRTAFHFTLEDVKRAEDDMDREYVERLTPRKNKPASKASRAG